jgi:predicted RND superfamily exporter protein
VIERLALFVTAWPRAVVITAIVLGAIGAWLGVARLRIDGDTDSLIAAERPFMQDYRAFQAEFGDLEGVVIAVDPKGSDAAGKRAIDAIAAQLETLQQQSMVSRIGARIEPAEQWRLASWSANDGELAAMAAAAPAIAAIARGEESAHPLVARALSQASSQAREPEYLRVPGGTLFLIEAIPAKDFTALEPFTAAIGAIRAKLDEVRVAHPDVDIGLTGKPVLQADEMSTANNDMMRASVGSLVVITVLFIIVFRGIRRPLLAVAAFAIASAWTYGAATIVVGRLTLLSTVFMLVLVGAGLDYGVHVVSRYGEMRRRFARAEAVRAALVSVGPGTITGAIGSASVFFLALATDFGGLRELGIVAGTGLLLCAIAMVTVLPALLTLAGDERGVEGHVVMPKVAMPTVATPKVAAPEPISPPTALSAIASAPPRVSTMLMACVPIVACLAGLPWAFGFQSNLLELQSSNLPSVRWERRLFEDSPGASWYAVSMADSLERVAALEVAAQHATAIARTESVLSLVKLDTPARAALRKQVADAVDAPLVALANPTPASEAARWIIEGAQASLRDALPAAVRDRMVSPGGKFLVQYFPSVDAWEEAPLASFVASVHRIDPMATGVPVTQLNSILDMRNAFTRVSWLSIIAVTLIAWFDFRRMSATLLATATVLAGVAMTLGLMPMMGIELNLANFFAIPMLIGLGIDSAVHIIHRARQDPAQLATTVRAVAFTALTTAIGFGSLVIAEHRGMRSLGLAMGVGSLCCMYVACVVLPLALVRQSSAPTNSGSTPAGNAARNRLP